MLTLLLIALIVAGTADVVTTLIGFRLGATERAPGYRRLPRLGVVAVRAGLLVAAVVAIRFVARQGGEQWETAGAVVAVAGTAAALVATWNNLAVIRKLRQGRTG